MSLEYKHVVLFGGAASCDVPADWVDASAYRDVPSHQEVFVHKHATREQSVIVEILQFESAVVDSLAGAFFFDDLATADAAASSTKSKGSMGEAMFLGTKATRVDVEGIQVKAKLGPTAPAQPVAVFMTAFRVPAFDADILVTTHYLVDEFGRDGIRDIHMHIARSLEFSDPTLFG